MKPGRMIVTTMFSIFLFSEAFAQSSVLATGDYYKLSVTQRGVYCITHSDLSSLGINVSSIDPRNLGIYGNPAGMLPVQNNVPHADDLKQLAIYVKGESDGVFDPGDTLFFYGESSVQIKLDTQKNRFYHRQNLYSDSVCYFLTIGNSPGKRIQTRASQPSFTNTTDKYTDFEFHELDSINFLHSGKKWFGEIIPSQSSVSFNFDITNISAVDSAFLNSESIERALNSGGSINLFFNGINKLMNYSIVGNSPQDSYGIPTILNNNAAAPITSGVVQIIHNSPDTSALSWVDFIELNFTRNLILFKSQQLFSDIKSASSGAVTKFMISNTPASLQIWDVTDPLNVVQQQFTLNISSAEFNAANDSIHTYIAFDGQTFLFPVFTGHIPNQDLHSLSQANMIILTDKRFHNEAQTLANFHQSHDNLNTIVADVDQIYNEYSSGVQDIVGIRDFVRQIFQRSASVNDSLKYLLLFGQASYDYKGHLGSHTSLVPTYESDGYLNQTNTFNTDNFFACVDSTATDLVSDGVELAVGRLPIKNSNDALVINKIINYSTPQTLGSWRKKIIPVADDGDHETHMKQEDTLMNRIENQTCIYDLNKIYIDEYVKNYGPPYPTYPGANIDLQNSIQDGALVFDYTGHGSETYLADERILDVSFLYNVKNINLPLFILATAQFNKFDDPSIISCGEVIALNDSGAGIASIGPARLAFSSSNFNLHMKLINYLFAKENNEYLRIGDIYKKAKQDYYLDPYVANVCLLGDPAVRLNYPQNEVATTLFNGQVPSANLDTLIPGQSFQISGEIHDNMGNLIPTFNGILNLTLFDQETHHLTLANDPGSSPFPFYQWDDTIYSDTVLVINGMFTETFNLPWSIDSGSGIGKISYYAQNGISDASGCYQNFIYKNLHAGIDEMAGVSVTFYPNPSSDKILFNISGIQVNDFIISLTDMEGKIVQRKNVNANKFYLERNSLAAGIYFFEIADKKKQLIKRGKILFE